MPHQVDWEPRRKGEMTTEYLGRVLENYLGLKDMAARARRGHFDDYFAPDEVADGMEIMRLVNELYEKTQTIQKYTPQYYRIMAVRKAAMEGEFDGTKEESDRWAVSKEGQELMKEFPEEVRKKLFGDASS
jgi:hypothetical protein